MFQKPLKIKSQTILKSSDRKKLRSELETQYPRLTAEQSLTLIPNKGHVTVARVHVHSGSEVIVYACENEPVVFVADRQIYPTVYAFWKFPDMVMSVATWSHVCSRIRDGADLMLPGVIIANQCLSPADVVTIRKGSICSVHSAGTRSPIAVGEAAMSGEDMLASGMRGKGFLIRHSYGDHLWALGSKSMPPTVSCPGCLPSSHAAAVAEASPCDGAENPGGSGGEEQKSAALAISESDGLATAGRQHRYTHDVADGDSQNAAALVGSPGTSNDSVENTECQEQPLANHTDRSIDSYCAKVEAAGNPADMMLYQCFLCALKTSLSKGDLPILVSNFFRNHLLPCCPPGETVDVKKTQYKKLSVFLKAMQSRGLLTVEEQSPGVEAIVKFDKSHPEVRSFKPWKVSEEDEADDSINQHANTGEFAAPLFLEMLCVTPVMAPLLQSAGYSKGDRITMQEVRQVLTEYIKANSLQCAEDKRCVTLDTKLSSCLLTKADGYVERLSWTDMFSRCASKLQEMHTITYPNGQVVTKKGSVRPLLMRVETRAGNKQVTLLENFEPFGIDSKQLAKDIRVGVACSTSITALPGKQQHGQQVLAQGDQSAFISNLLQGKYKVPLKYLDMPE